MFVAPQTRGKDGSVRDSYVLPGEKWKLDAASKKSYPLELINVIRRQAEDLLLGDSDEKNGKDALRFVLRLAQKRSDLEEMKKGKLKCYQPAVRLIYVLYQKFSLPRKI